MSCFYFAKLWSFTNVTFSLQGFTAARVKGAPRQGLEGVGNRTADGFLFAVAFDMQSRQRAQERFGIRMSRVLEY